MTNQHDVSPESLAISLLDSWCTDCGDTDSTHLAQILTEQRATQQELERMRVLFDELTAETNEAKRVVIDDMLDALKVTAGNIRSLLASSSGQVFEPYTVWLRVVDEAIAKAEQ